jgi:hypothetical protein
MENGGTLAVDFADGRRDGSDAPEDFGVQFVDGRRDRRPA